jgi:hypothetical protein
LQTSQTGGQWYSDTSPFSIPWFNKPTSALVIVDPQVCKIYFRFCQMFCPKFLTKFLETNGLLDLTYVLSVFKCESTPFWEKNMRKIDLAFVFDETAREV